MSMTRKGLAEDIRRVVNVNGATTVTVELPADYALILARDIEAAAKWSAPVVLQARVRGRIDA